MDWMSLLAPGMAGALGSVLFVWLVNRRSKNEELRVELKTGPVVFWFNLIGGVLIFCLGFLFGFAIFGMDDVTSGNAVLLFGLALFVCLIGGGGIWSAWDSRTRWARWSHANIIIHQKKGPEKAYAFGDISKLKYMTLLQLWQIHFADGEKFIFSEMMTGSKELIALCNKHLYDMGAN